MIGKNNISTGVGVRMTQRQNDTVRHFGTQGHFNTATKRPMRHFSTATK